MLVRARGWTSGPRSALSSGYRPFVALTKIGSPLEKTAMTCPVFFQYRGHDYTNCFALTQSRISRAILSNFAAQCAMVMVLSQGMKAYIIVGARMINGRTRPEFQWLSSSGILMAQLVCRNSETSHSIDCPSRCRYKLLKLENSD